MTDHCLRILHLTDLHERGPRETESWRRRRVLGDAWLKNLDAIGTVDLLCFTGDLADRGQPQEYEKVAEFLEATLQRLKLPRERLFVVPGNHDVDRGIGSVAWKKLREHLHRPAAQEVSRWFAGGPAPFGFDDADRDALLARRAAYHDFLRDFGLPHLLPGCGAHPLLGWRQTLALPYPLHLIGLDTAWLAGDDHDAGALRLTEDQVMRQASGADGQSLPGLRIALMHHPFDELADGAHCRRLLAEYVDVVLRGHLHETEPTLWADPDRRLAQLASGCLYEGRKADDWPNACALLELHLDANGRPQRSHLRLRGWTKRGFWFDDNSLYRDTRDGWLPWTGHALPSRPDAIHRRVENVFAGRDRELALLARALLPADGAPRPVAVCAAVQGMAGIGKSYLVDRFFAQHCDRFPGGYVRLTLDPQSAVPDLCARLLGLLDLPGGSDPLLAIRARLRDGPALLHIENVDSQTLGDAVVPLVEALAACPVAISGRLASLKLKQADGWQPVELGVLSPAEALDQLRQELGAQLCRQFPDADLARLAARLGHLPLALHLAAGHLRAGRSIDGFLGKLANVRLALPSATPGEHQPRALLHSTFQLSLDLLRERLGAAAARLLPGLHAFAHGPAGGVLASLGTALSGLSAEDYEELCCNAVALSLLDADETRRLRLHLLLAEWLREADSEAAVLARMTDWFCARLPELPAGRESEQGQCWRELHAEHAAMADWLARVPAFDAIRVERAGSWYALINGPFAVWQSYCERLLNIAGLADEVRSNTLWTLANVAFRSGDPDRALSAAKEKAELDAKSGAERECALANGLLADILQTRGELDEALRIRREEEMPVYERLGDVRSKAVTQGKIADILQLRGELDEALRIRREEQMPVYERLGDVRAKAVTQGKIANILQTRGKLDEALRICREEQMPVYESLGDVREKAVTQDKIADILQMRGELDEALCIRREEQMPAYERLGDVRSKAVTQGKIADILQSRGELDEALRIFREDVLTAFERLRDVRSKAVTQGRIADILQKRGELDEALRIRREEELPVYERLGDVRSKAVTQGQIADILQLRGELDAALTLHEARLPVARKMQDIESIAHALGSIANIRMQRGDHQQAAGLQEIFDALSEAFVLYRQIGRPDGIAAIGHMLALVMLMGGLKDEVPAVLDATESAYRTLDGSDGITQVQQLRELLSQRP